MAGCEQVRRVSASMFSAGFPLCWGEVGFRAMVAGLWAMLCEKDEGVFSAAELAAYEFFQSSLSGLKDTYFLFTARVLSSGRMCW